MTLEYKFPAAKEAAWETIVEGRELWMNVGQQTAQSKVDSQAASRGYNLSIGIGKERIGHQSARIYTTAHSQKWGDDPWWARFFEYGTVQIPAMPFIRPAARRANTVFVAYVGGALEGKIRLKPMRRKVL